MAALPRDLVSRAIARDVHAEFYYNNTTSCVVLCLFCVNSIPSLKDTQIAQGLLPSLPNFFNVRSTSNRVDDLGVVVQKNCIDFAGITETWLNSNTPDSSILRKDRSGQCGGVEFVHS